MPPRPKPFAGLRRAVRLGLARALPASVVDQARAAYFGRWSLARATDADEPDLAVVRRLLHPGDTAIDGGANYGRIADALAEAVGPQGRVLAIEPIPQTARLLRRVLDHRHRAQVEVVEVALSDTPGSGQMVIPNAPTGESNFYRAHLADGTGVTVALDTLDSVAARLPRPPALVKLDLEGHERVALGGATGLLESGAAWLVELNDDPDEVASDAYAVEALFQAHGYTPWVYRAATRTLSARRPGPRGPNVFYLRPHHLSQLEAIGAVRIAG